LESFVNFINGAPKQAGVQFNFLTLPFECYEWSTTFISVCLRRWPRVYFRKECFFVDESMAAAPRTNHFLAPNV